MHAMAGAGVLLILLAVIGLGMMGGWGAAGPGWMMGWGRSAPSGSAAAPIAGAQQLPVSLVDFGFRPGDLRVQAGVPVNLELVNTGRILHDLTIPALGFRVMVEPGQRVTVGLPAVSGGAYEFYCSVPGHREAGMIGRLFVQQ